MLNLRLFFYSLLFLLLSACQNESILSDRSYRQTVIDDFKEKQDALLYGNLFNDIEIDSPSAEQEALLFLYAYMPIGDITDYSPDFYKNNIRYSFLAREEMPWGEIIPEDIFRHFVLPIRINNENLDNSREVFYHELKERVKSLSLYDAVLEVNHWCHEKVIYEPSDSRTSSPLASVKTASGRCGEESTFLVAALRSVGIPARQVYTPRWAHTDDNHAWVEAWVDGKWYFMGACEPEPVLNLGWFNAPASRGMLMHTKVFGRYTGPEEIMSQTDNYTEINVIENYAPTTRGCVRVVDERNNPVANASVEFKIYNYAEFFTVATKQSDVSGKAHLTAGKGDLLVWAAKDGKFGYGKLSLATDSLLTVVLNKQDNTTFTDDIDIIPPKEGKIDTPEVSPKMRLLNDCRMHSEDSIRTGYTSTFLSAKHAANIANVWGKDSAVIANLLIKSRGNHTEIITFLASVSVSNRGAAIALLQQISAKDLRDTPADVLTDHLLFSKCRVDSALFVARVLNPRMANELLTPYKSFFQKEIRQDQGAMFQNDPEKLVNWCRNEIKVNNVLNSQRIPISPAGVWRARVADTQSRNTFFVAVARSLGIPAWIDEVTGKTLYADLNRGNCVCEVNFESETPKNSITGTLIADYQISKQLDNPKYYTHFSISKIENGRARLLNYEEGDTDMGEGASWNGLLKNGVKLDAGYYLLVTGTRMAKGNVLTRLSFFTIEPQKCYRTLLEMPENQEDIEVIGNFNSENKFNPTDGEDAVSLLQTTGRGYYITAILGVNQEPTNHALRDMAAVKDRFEKWGRKMVFLFPNEASYKRYNASAFSTLPDNIIYGIDTDNRIQQEMISSLKLSDREELPIFIIADTFNRVVFVSQGYTIGLGEQLLKVIDKL